MEKFNIKPKTKALRQSKGLINGNISKIVGEDNNYRGWGST